MLIKVDSDAPKFKCGACGTCCSHIRGAVPEQDAKFLNENLFGKMPIVQLVPVERMTFPLWDWEAKRFIGWQHEAKVNARISPLRAIMDLKSNKAIVISYFMDSESDACALLKNGKCSIYGTRRAYVCRMFPFNKSPFIKGMVSGINLKQELFGECGAMGQVLANFPEDLHEMAKFLNEAFPDASFINAVQNGIVIEWVNKTIVDLIRKNIINPAFGYPYKFLSRRVSACEKIDFTDFLVEFGYLTAGERETLLNRFDNNAEATEKISNYKNF